VVCKLVFLKVLSRHTN